MEKLVKRLEYLEQCRYLAVTEGMLSDLERKQKFLSQWERGFIKRCREWFTEHNALDAKRFDMLENIYLKKCYRAS